VQLLHTLELARHFELLVISDRVGYLKPHGGIFRHALDLAEVDATQAIHVGDSVRADVRGASSVGIRPVLIERHTHVHAEAGGAAPASLGRDVDASVPVISDLNDLLDLLDVPRPVSVAAS
jgi:FMN phosphatase YigB (HAD superfamily)